MTIGTARLEKQSGQGLRPDRQHELSRHAHNGFLQIWFELGGIGAALLAIAGLAIPALLRRLEPFPFPFAVVAAWMTTAILLFSSAYGLWQIWLLCGYALTATFLAVVLRGFSLNNDAAGASDLVGEGTASP